MLPVKEMKTKRVPTFAELGIDPDDFLVDMVDLPKLREAV